MNLKHKESIYHANANVDLMKENVIQINGGIMINVDVNVKNVCEKDYVWNPDTCYCENRKYLASIMGDSAIMCDEVIESYNKATSNNKTKFNKEKATCKTQNFMFYLHFY